MQQNLRDRVEIPRSAYDYGSRASGEVHGVVLTKAHVVELILDLAGYTARKDLTRARLLEPAVGHGAFVVAAVRRLLACAQKRGRPARELARCITAVDIDPDHVQRTRAAVGAELERGGITGADARHLLNAWIREGDFLLTPDPGQFDYVVGNPPYIRIEALSPVLLAEYRRRFRSLYDRADLYVAFIERSLALLNAKGTLAFICADRWTCNRYGAPLRALITGDYQVTGYVNLHGAAPFESEVIAYPSIMVVQRGGARAPSRNVPVFAMTTAAPEQCAAVVRSLRSKTQPAAPGVTRDDYDEWFAGDEPWILSSPAHRAALRDLEKRFAPIENTTRVGIGVATGNDKIFIVDESADIEPDRLVPLVMRSDMDQGTIRDARRFVINTFAPDGGLIELSRYPRLEKYLHAHEATIRQRHVARKNPNGWFRTIDRVYPALANTPKLLIPDIAGANQVVFEPGRLHPHHNLYFVTSEVWDPEVLGALLSSRVALFFVWCYAVKMRGGYLRFQAQYLRRIRLPAPDAIGRPPARALKQAFRNRDFARLDDLALQAYGLKSLPAFEFVDTRA